jgi:fimbrial chaperone protein
MKMKSLLHQAVGGLVLFLLGTGIASAGSFQVSPINPTLSASKPVSALTVRNTGADPVVVQLEALAWSQPGGKDTYLPAPEILATPPIFTIPAGGSQTIRVGSRVPSDAHGERAYRLLLREIPPPPKPGFNGLRMALQVSLPLFVLPVAPATSHLQWQATRTADGQVRITATNAGQAHVHLSGFKLSDAGAKPLHMPTAAVYVLPGASHEWLVDADVASGATLQLMAQDDARAVQAELVVAGR